MTWDPRDLGQPKRITHPPAPPEPPAPPPRSYELRLADWDDARVTAERAGLRFRDPLPLPDDEAGVPLYELALQEQLQRDIYGMLRGPYKEVIEDPLFREGPKFSDFVDAVQQKVAGTVGLPRHWFGQIVHPPLPAFGSFTVKVGPKADAVLGRAEGQEVKLDGLPWGVVESTERLPDGSAQCTVRLGPAKPLNDFLRQRYPFPPIDFGDARPEALDANHRALVDVPTATMREIIMRSPGATGDACGDLADWLEDEGGYRGMDAD